MSQFDAKAVDWDEDPKRVAMSEKAAAAIAETIALTPEMNALEIGCGTGLVAATLANKLASITAVDTSEGMLNVLRQKIEATEMDNIIPVFADLTKDKAVTGPFDLIYSVMAFHHIKNIQPLLDDCYDLLTPGGRLLVIDLDTEDGSFHKPDADYEHKGFGRDALKTMLEAAGFANMTHKTAHVMTRETEQGKRDFSLFLMTGEKV